MGNTRTWTTKFNARVNELQSSLKSAGIRSDKKRRELINRAASSRPSDLAEQARRHLEQWRADRSVKADLDQIAGRS